MAYVKAIYKKRGKQSEKDLLKRNEIINSGLKEYLNDDRNNYNYYFDKDEPRDDKGDDETCYLSAIIFLNLIIKYFKTINGLNRVNEKDTRLYYFLTDADSTAGSRMIRYNGGEAIIGFDVMNSVKKSKLISESDKLNIEQLEKIYHKIGNFIFYPRAIVREKGGKNDLNIVHNVECHENWTKVLVYLKEHWSEYQFSDGFCLFEEYIKMSLQQFYTKVGWDEVKKLVENPKKYNEIISNEKNLIDFYKKIENDNCVEEIEYNEYSIKIIIAIIEIRTRLIIIMVRKFLESEDHSK